MNYLTAKKKSKGKKPTKQKKWFMDCQKAIKLIQKENTGIPKWVLIQQMDISLWSFNKLQPIILEMGMLKGQPGITYNKKTKKFVYNELEI